MPIFRIPIIASNARRRLAALREQPGQAARRDLPRQAEAVPAPAARALLAAVIDDRVPVAVGLGLVIGRDLEARGLVTLCP